MGKKIKDLDDVVEIIKTDEKQMLLFDDTYKGTIISMADLNKAMDDLLKIDNQEYKKRDGLPKRIPIKFESSIGVYITTSEAIKNVLNFVKEIDDNLYIQSLKLFIDLKEGTINIYNLYDEDVKKKIRNRELSKRSCNNNNGTYVVLREYIDEKTAKEISNVVKSDKCSIYEMIKLMHELSHNFDKKFSKLVPTGEQILNYNCIYNTPQVTEFYLCETTAVFFETIFGDYLVKQKPELRSIVEEKIKNRILTNLKCVNETRMKSDLVLVSEKEGKVPDDFLDKTVPKRKKAEIEKRLLRDPDLYVARRYANSMFLVPTMVKVYRENPEKGNERIRKYLECCKNDDFDGALASFGINVRDKDNYNKALENYRDYIIKYLYSENRCIEQEDIIK